jgi:hypothetical protein
MVARALVVGALLGFGVASLASAQGQASYRNRLLGVYDSRTGDPIEGVEVTDLLGKLTALTSATGTVSLAFLPDGETMLRIRKVGYNQKTMAVAISPVDTVPYTVLLERTATVLPTMVTKDSAVTRWSSRLLREFEERRRQGFGQFLEDSILRLYDAGSITSAIRRLSGIAINCGGGSCGAVSTRSRCRIKVYRDGMPAEPNLENHMAWNYAGVEYYNTANIPPQYNTTGNACGVLLLWTRERL